VRGLRARGLPGARGLSGARFLPAGIAAAVVVLASASCTSDNGGDSGGDSADELDARMADARDALDDAASIDLQLTTEELPDGVEGLLAAVGVGNHDPAFDGVVTVRSNALGTFDADVVALDGDVYAELPFSAGYTPVDPGRFGAPDPAELLAADGGVSDWLTSATQLSDGGETRDGEQVLSTVTGTLPGQSVARLIPSADASADFEAEFRLDDDDQLRGASITGPFYPGGDDVTYDLSAEPSEDDVEITAP
jgi:lipoprotein LprG